MYVKEFLAEVKFESNDGLVDNLEQFKLLNVVLSIQARVDGMIAVLSIVSMIF